MHRIILYISAATIAFIIGVTSSTGIETLGGYAIEKIYDTEPPAEFKPPTLLAGPLSVPAGVHSCGYLQVTVTSDGALYLRGQEAGTLSDTSALTKMLGTIFEQREELHAYMPSTDISSAIPERWQIERTVFIKAPRGMRYGEVLDLIDAIKVTGADPVGLMTDRPID
jgi:biopolymer transport protein ExbD